MNIVTTTSVFPKEHPATVSLERLHRVGYSCLDLALDYCVYETHPLRGAHWREWAEELCALAKARGVRYTHAHAPWNASVRNETVRHCFEVCKILGIGYMVVHPIHKQDEKIITDDAEFIRINAEAVRLLLPYAEEYGVIILSENLLWGSSIQPCVIADLVKTVNHPYFGWCYDTGHAHCNGISSDCLKTVSAVPLSLHIQDNSGERGRDEHLLPGDGTIDWKEFLDVLSEIGYGGELVLEAHHQSLDAADGEREDILCTLLERAEKMKAYMERMRSSQE